MQNHLTQIQAPPTIICSNVAIDDIVPEATLANEDESPTHYSYNSTQNDDGIYKCKLKF